MNVITSALATPYLFIPVCTAAGFVICKASLAVNQIASKVFGAPIDMYQGQNEEQYSQAFLFGLKFEKILSEISLKYRIGQMFIDNCVIIPVNSAIFYRYCVESIFLPLIFPQFAAFSIARTCVSSLIYASASYLTNPGTHGTRETRAGSFIHHVILATICSIAREKFGLLASIFTHSGFNLCATLIMISSKKINVFNCVWKATDISLVKRAIEFPIKSIYAIAAAIVSVVQNSARSVFA